MDYDSEGNTTMDYDDLVYIVEQLEGRLEAFEAVHDQDMEAIKDDLYGLESDISLFCLGLMDSIKRRVNNQG